MRPRNDALGRDGEARIGEWWMDQTRIEQCDGLRDDPLMGDGSLPARGKSRDPDDVAVGE